MAFLPAGRFLVTERPGRLRVVEPDGRLGAPIAGLPDVAAQGQGGLLDVVLDSAFEDNRQLYFCYAQPAANGAGNSTALARVSARASEHFFPAALVDNQFATLEPPTGEAGVLTVDATAPQEDLVANVVAWLTPSATR